MYRQYENPYKVQEMLTDAERRLAEAQAQGADIDVLVGLHDEVEELRERVNFAWQDDEADAYGYDY